MGSLGVPYNLVLGSQAGVADNQTPIRPFQVVSHAAIMKSASDERLGCGGVIEDCAILPS
jgi:hypothetical protein